MAAEHGYMVRTASSFYPAMPTSSLCSSSAETQQWKQWLATWSVNELQRSKQLQITQAQHQVGELHATCL
jgi:hypothetical protein